VLGEIHLYQGHLFQYKSHITDLISSSGFLGEVSANNIPMHGKAENANKISLSTLVSQSARISACVSFYQSTCQESGG